MSVAVHSKLVWICPPTDLSLLKVRFVYVYVLFCLLDRIIRYV